jgi:hypothetical protein
MQAIANSIAKNADDGDDDSDTKAAKPPAADNGASR